MNDKKQIEELAEEILQEYTNCYSEVDKEVLAEKIYNAGNRKQSDLTPCDVCRFNPPSSADGKPCLVCPAQAKGGAE